MTQPDARTETRERRTLDFRGCLDDIEALVWEIRELDAHVIVDEETLEIVEDRLAILQLQAGLAAAIHRALCRMADL